MAFDASGRPIPLGEAELDAPFQQAEDALGALPESPERAAAISCLWMLWSLATLRLVQLRPIEPARIQAALFDAQIAACWAAGDGDKV